MAFQSMDGVDEVDTLDQDSIMSSVFFGVYFYKRMKFGVRMMQILSS
jgi:hypothetical protein